MEQWGPAIKLTFTQVIDGFKKNITNTNSLPVSLGSKIQSLIKVLEF